MRYSDELIEEVRSRNDIVDVIGGYVRLKRAGSNYTGLCPFHNEKTPSFSVSRTKQMFYCFGCHEGGNVLTFMMKYNNMSFVEAMQALADRAGISLPQAEYSGEAKEQADRRELLLAVNKKAAAYYYYTLRSDADRRGIDYLRGRGLSDETLKKFGLGFTGRSGGLYGYLKKEGYSDEILRDSGLFTFDEKRGASDKFWNRVMFPIMDARGRVIGFGGRVMGDAKPKYLNSPETPIFNKRRNLFGLNLARATRRKYFILCEGYMDVISMHQAGFDSAVASLGTALTPEQASLLHRYTEQVLLLYDSDGAGRMAAVRAISILKDAGIHSRVVDLTPYKDPDEFIRALGAEEMERRLSSANDAFIFRVRDMAKDYLMEDPQQRTAFLHALGKMFLEFPEELERSTYIEALAREYNFSPDSMRKLVNQYALRGVVPDRERTAPSAERKNPAKKENGQVKSEKLMLTYLANYPEAYEQTRKFIGPDDFKEPLCREIADRLYRQLAEGSVNEAVLVNTFTEANAQSEVAELFHTVIRVEDGQGLDRAFTDTVVRLLSGSLASVRGDYSTDPGAVMEYVRRKKQLEEFRNGTRKLHLTYKEEMS